MPRKDPEQARLYRLGYYRRNREKILAYMRDYSSRYREENAERLKISERERGRRAYAADPEKARQKQREWQKSTGHANKRRAENTERAREIDREYYAKNRESQREKRNAARAARREEHRRWTRANVRKRPMQATLNRIKAYSKKHGLACDLTLEWLQERFDAGVCELSGLPFDKENFRPFNRDRPSIDRRIPGGPYTQENCRMILWSINRALCSYGEDYVLGVFAAILKRREEAAACMPLAEAAD
jgi:hypothetical protein